MRQLFCRPFYILLNALSNFTQCTEQIATLTQSPPFANFPAKKFDNWREIATFA
jgi:hypothetical protein